MRSEKVEYKFKLRVALFSLIKILRAFNVLTLNQWGKMTLNERLLAEYLKRRVR